MSILSLSLLPFAKRNLRRSLLLLVLLFTTWGLVISCSSSVNQVKNLQLGQGEQMIVLGDSIASGYGVQVEQAFPSLLSRRLNVPILNQGVAGDTTALGLARLQTDVLDQNPWLVMVELSGNDYLQRIPETETEENLRQIITRIQAQGAIAVILGINVGVVGDNYDRLFEDLAKETQAYLIPQILKGLHRDERYRQDDIIHPSAAGHQIISDRVFEGLQPLLKAAKIPPTLENLVIEE
ncbi:GDSL-type esterase/lipase family protein [Roseofilum sp. BLCC_M91]|uniref:GDSL-type esterase/lipase family protein n=1 Tax=Roseofilum halophilum BLCC-M91 TaxID=3022259 RepID=A0ABT7BKA4_9CYAN|nr:GDSL-type esterase/lipase family protein [Roseofilum halophilum]MDJ1179622.1 GDSL-type esterase/lipase family protein [Roseofilum halophilum BLCC-M91]